MVAPRSPPPSDSAAPLSGSNSKPAPPPRPGRVLLQQALRSQPRAQAGSRRFSGPRRSLFQRCSSHPPDLPGGGSGHETSRFAAGTTCSNPRQFVRPLISPIYADAPSMSRTLPPRPLALQVQLHHIENTYSSHAVLKKMNHLEVRITIPLL